MILTIFLIVDFGVSRRLVQDDPRFGVRGDAGGIGRHPLADEMLPGAGGCARVDQELDPADGGTALDHERVGHGLKGVKLMSVRGPDVVDGVACQVRG